MAESYAVDLDKKTCTCRVWKLNGYGCVHSVATISFLNRDVGGYVDTMFYGAVYTNTYKYLIQGMNGSNMWPPTDFIPPLPPMKRRMPGRPKCLRQGKKYHAACKNVGHNKVTFPQAERPQVQKPEVGRRPKLNVKKRKTGVNEKGEGVGGVNEQGEGVGGVNEKGEEAGGVNEGQKGQGAKSVHEGKKDSLSRFLSPLLNLSLQNVRLILLEQSFLRDPE
ncbi:unnamed protein product [Lactuca virosa]|uniref:SWIM-type domain-containing protein n=1 Tax=Lactuca virosa TaxID=75947 RepID=A0AAU9LNM9_9ASTR|nr:unnamed protein product [Lactuca virosa]